MSKSESGRAFLVTKWRATCAVAVSMWLVLGIASSALADPTLFTGLGKQGGGIVGPAYGLVTTIYGPGSASPGVASVTPSGNFTLPALAFAKLTSYTFSIPPTYPYAFVKITQSNLAGDFGKSYLTPSAVVVGAGTNAIQPAVTGTPRTGFVRFMVGKNGFGGRMPMTFDKYYVFDILTTAAGISKAKAQDYDQTFGGASVGAFAEGGITANGYCCTTFPTAAPSVVFTAAVGTQMGPWMTGMATAYDLQGANVTPTTATGSDNRTAFDSGTISLVTPRLQYIHQGDGNGTLVSLRDAFGIVHQVEVTFAPEPTHALLLASGVCGALALLHLRRRR